MKHLDKFFIQYDRQESGQKEIMIITRNINKLLLGRWIIDKLPTKIKLLIFTFNVTSLTILRKAQSRRRIILLLL